MSSDLLISPDSSPSEARQPQATITDPRISKIFESYKMADLFAVAATSSKRKYILIDVDNTLTAPKNQEIGSAQWRSYIKKKAVEEGYTPDEAEEVLDMLWYYVMPQIQVRLVDEEARAVIQKEQATTPVLGFTAREYKEVPHTEKQLDTLSLSFANTHFDSEIELQLAHRGLYKNGILYCGENGKGETLLAFFLATGQTPEEVYVADDKKEQLTGVDKSAAQKNVSFIGSHLRIEDEKVASFDGAIADLQLEMLPRLVSNEEAKEMLASNPRPRLKLREFIEKLSLDFKNL